MYRLQLDKIASQVAGRGCIIRTLQGIRRDFTIQKRSQLHHLQRIITSHNLTLYQARTHSFSITRRHSREDKIHPLVGSHLRRAWPITILKPTPICGRVTYFPYLLLIFLCANILCQPICYPIRYLVILIGHIGIPLDGLHLEIRLQHVHWLSKSNTDYYLPNFIETSQYIYNRGN